MANAPKPTAFSPAPGFRLDARAVIALGSNQGDRRAHLERACRTLGRLGVRVARRSRLYWTRPWGEGIAAQPWYLNAAIAVDTALGPIELLDRCQASELEMGRIRRARWEPRVIDIDLIFFGDVRMESPRLTLPHPSWWRRDFVIAPLLDLGIVPPAASAPPGSRGLRDLLARAERCVFSEARWD